MSNNRPDYRGNPLDFIGTLADVAGGLGNWIANGTPSAGSIPAEIQQRYRDHCDSWSNGPTWVQQIDPGARLFLSNACKPWLDSQGSGDPSPGDQTPETGTLDFSAQGGAILRGTSASGSNRFRGGQSFTFSMGTGDTPFNVTSIDCDGNFVGLLGSATPWVVNTIGFCNGDSDPPPFVRPNPNPRPDPGLDPEDEPFDRRPGQPLTPMPEIENPFGDPIQLPNLPLPNPGPQEDEGQSNPNVGPPVEPGDEIEGDPNDPGDDEFGDPPEGHIWVGFLVELSDQGVTEGLQVGSPPEPIYRSSTGNYRAVYEIEGEKVYSTPFEIRQQSSTYFLDLPGLTLVAARVNVPSNDSYSVTPLSQPVEQEEPQEI